MAFVALWVTLTLQWEMSLCKILKLEDGFNCMDLWMSLLLKA